MIFLFAERFYPLFIDLGKTFGTVKSTLGGDAVGNGKR